MSYLTWLILQFYLIYRYIYIYIILYIYCELKLEISGVVIWLFVIFNIICEWFSVYSYTVNCHIHLHIVLIVDLCIIQA